MKLFFPNKVKFFILFIPVLFVFGSSSLAFISSSKLDVKTLGVITLLILFVLIYKLWKFIKSPLIVIDDNQIIIRHLFIKDRTIKDFSQYKLIISTDYLAFRKGASNDILISMGDLSKKSWNNLLLDLSELPFIKYN